MNKHLPFYMVYNTEPLGGGFPWGDDFVNQRDYEYMKSAYPDMVKRIVPYVDEECDRLEYSGSMMYDEYPDQLQVRMLCRRIYDRVVNESVIRENAGKWLSDLIQVIVWQEIMKRRNDYRKYRRKFY